MSSVRAPRTALRVAFRPTEAGDLAALGALFDDRFGHPVTAEEWEWKYRRLPGEARSWVAVDEEGRVLAHAGALCLPARVRRADRVRRHGVQGGTREAPIWQLTDWAGTATATGLRPPLVRLGRQLLHDLPRPDDAPWIFGFPSERHFRLGQRVFGYRTLPAVVELGGEIAAALEAAGSDGVGPGPVGRTDPSDLAVPAEHCGDWPEAAEAAWEACGVLGVRRSADFLNWRYHARPGRYYRFYRLRAAAGPERDGATGLAVFAFVGAEALAAELWLPPLPPVGGEARAVSAWLPALAAVAADLAASGLSRWRFWPPPADPFRAAGAADGVADLLVRLGVQATGGARFMGSRGATRSPRSSESLEPRDPGHPADPHFYYAMGDYDLV